MEAHGRVKTPQGSMCPVPEVAQVLERRAGIRKRSTTNDNTPVQTGPLTGQAPQDRGFGHTARHGPARTRTTRRGAGPLCLNLASGP